MNEKESLWFIQRMISSSVPQAKRYTPARTTETIFTMRSPRPLTASETACRQNADAMMIPISANIVCHKKRFQSATNGPPVGALHRYSAQSCTTRATTTINAKKNQ